MGKVLHASYSGYFPFCVPRGTITSGSFIAVSLVEAMNIYWKVRRMNYVFEYNADLYFIYSKEKGKIQRSLYSYEYSPMELEENLVCGNFSNYWSYDATQTIGSETYSISPYSFFPGFDSGNIFDWEQMVQSNGIFYIPIDLFKSLGDNSPATYTLNYAGTHPGQEFPATINIFGYSIQALYWGYGYIFGEGFKAIKITIDPEEYWSYAGTYNTATGNPL